MFSIKVNGVIVANKKNTDARSFKNVKIFAGDEWYSAGNARIRNLKVETIV